VETLEAILYTNWGVRPDGVQLLPAGHTNKSFLVRCGSRAAVLRVSWPGKSAAQVQREAAVLDHLNALPKLPVLPRTRTTLAGQAYVPGRGGHWLHLYEHISGSSGLPDDTTAGTANAMRSLAHLHTALTAIPVSDASPVAWLRERYERVSSRPAPPLPTALLANYGLLLRRVDEHLADAMHWIPGPVRWLHGDYHAGNLLFIDRTVNGILDFDGVAQGSQSLETAFALFALTRDTGLENRFAFDPLLWDTGLEAYARIRPDIAMAQLVRRRDALMLLFCADQALTHLEAAQRGLWTLRAGIGFFACWHQLLTGLPTRSA
jgi:Ser/Thr protein kinase RdoA (MazF antagonist)